MSRIITTLFAALVGFAGFASFDGVTASSVDPHPHAELDWGSFSGSDELNAHPESFVWVYSDEGVRTEVWVLYKLNQSGGWNEPGSANTSMKLQLDYLGNPTHADIDGFKDWVEDWYDTNYPLLAVDQTTDFTVHVHTVTVH